jgi:16S rRNA G1207 methylase RsmC
MKQKNKILLKTKLKNFYLKSPKKIINSLDEFTQQTKTNILDLDFILLPNVYPSQCFRTTKFLLESISEKVFNKNVCDMGCGMGIIGIFSLLKGAKRVIQIDINSQAVENAIANKNFYKYKEEFLSIYQSDCFDNVPKEIFDLIIFNIPFHSDFHEYKNEVEYAFFDSKFRSVKKFLTQCKLFAHKETEIIIAFSNKGDIKTLESLFEKYGYEWELWKTNNEKAKYDNRLYLLKL